MFAIKGNPITRVTEWKGYHQIFKIKENQQQRSRIVFNFTKLKPDPHTNKYLNCSRINYVE